MSPKEIEKLLNSSTKIKLLGKRTIRYNKAVYAKLVAAIKENSKKISKKIKSDIDKIEENKKNLNEKAKTDFVKIQEKALENSEKVNNKVQDTKVNIVDFVNGKKVEYLNYIKEEYEEELNKKLDVVTKTATEDLIKYNNILIDLENNTEMDHDDKKICIDAIESKLTKIESLETKKINKLNSGLGVFALSKITISKLRKSYIKEKEIKAEEKAKQKIEKNKVKKQEELAKLYKKQEEIAKKIEAYEKELVVNTENQMNIEENEVVEEVSLENYVNEVNNDELLNLEKSEEIKTIEDKIMSIEIEIQELLLKKDEKGQGKKQYITFREENFDFPKKHIKKLRYLTGLSIRYTKMLEESKIIEHKEEMEPEVIVVSELENKKVSKVKKVSSETKKKVGIILLSAAVLIGAKGLLSHSETKTPDLVAPQPSYDETYTPDDVVEEENFSVEEETFDSNEEVLDAGKLSLGSEVLLNENANIYIDSYSATEKVSGLSRYYTSSDERYISGLTYKLGEKLTTVYYNAENSESTIKELEEQGAVITAVLISNSMGYEGYMSKDDVTLVEYEKEITR